MKRYLTVTIALVALVIALRAWRGESISEWVIVYWTFNSALCLINVKGAKG